MEQVIENENHKGVLIVSFIVSAISGSVIGYVIYSSIRDGFYIKDIVDVLILTLLGIIFIGGFSLFPLALAFESRRWRFSKDSVIIENTFGTKVVPYNKILGFSLKAKMIPIGKPTPSLRMISRNLLTVFGEDRKKLFSLFTQNQEQEYSFVRLLKAIPGIKQF